jgi:antitoxin (DNA-binding transcriptional repressor) of toxin-antitoxin stability system
MPLIRAKINNVFQRTCPIGRSQRLRRRLKSGALFTLTASNAISCYWLQTLRVDPPQPATFSEKQPLPKTVVRLILSDMKMLTARDLNRKTASVLDAVERGETFELRRSGRAVGYITRTPPNPQRRPDWKNHFEWLRRQATKTDAATLAEFEQERRRQAARERELGNLK